MTTGHNLCAGLAAALVLSLAAAALAADAPETPPAWAFPVNPPGHQAPLDKPGTIEHVAGSAAGYRFADMDNPHHGVNWFPGEHPPMPAIVAVGRPHGAMACSFCHNEAGLGGPESAALAGLPASYIVEQVEEMRAGRRAAAQAKMIAPNGMIEEAKMVGAADLKTAADYFSRLPFRARVRVVETDTVPKATVQGVSIWAKAPGAGREKLGPRILEMPDDLRQWALGNPHASYVAYVPKGSIARGKALVASGNGALPCRSCHGADLQGVGVVPGIAGRSPSYLARQLYDIEYGARKGPAVALMQPEVAHLRAADRIAIVAYLASLRG